MQTPATLSYSSVDMFRRCPASWKAKYIDKIQQPVGDAAKFGNDFDTAVAHELGITPVGHDGKEVPKPDLGEELTGALEMYRKYPKSWLKSPEGSVQAQVRITVTPEQWHEIARRYGGESEIEMPLVGYADFLRTMPDGRREVMDLKTVSRDEWKAGWYTQVILYSAWLDASLMHIHRVLRNKSKCKVDASTTVIDGNPELVRQTMDTFAYDANELARFIRSARWIEAPRRPDWHCMFCPLADKCETRLVVK